MDGIANVFFCDNKSVGDSTCQPESSLKKKNVFIAYHKCREMFVVDILNMYFHFSKYNLVELITQVLPVVKKKYILNDFLHGSHLQLIHLYNNI